MVWRKLCLLLAGFPELYEAAAAGHWNVGHDSSFSGTTGNAQDAFLSTPAALSTPPLTPKQFLVISSPALSKIVYGELQNFQVPQGRTFALVDSGLDQPCGVAIDHTKGHLYVADRGAKSIYRYRMYVGTSTDRDGNAVSDLTTDGDRLTLVTGRGVEWLTLTTEGDLLFSDASSKSIIRLPAETLESLAEGSFQAEDLQLVSEKTMEAMESAKATKEMNGEQAAANDDADAKPQMFAVYESSANQFVDTPAGIATDGIRLWWGNQKGGTTSGSVSQGSVHPKVPPASGSGGSVGAFPAKAVSKVANTAFGVARTSNLIVFSSNTTTLMSGGSLPQTGGAVYGVPQNGGAAFAFATGLGAPRGLVWDGDNTVYVADSTLNTVWSFPAGRLVDNAPLAKAVDFTGAYGVALLQESDRAWSPSAAAGMSWPAMWIPIWAAFVVTSAAGAF
eukprot:TRINITY_DN26749_c0_g1_i1.p1 TRINITY_DN26749_c0_g1~~TRINITY_DN26749_c0_g1_i1.p1  ORF type:complete len:471 (+),score=50.26 TRINITY_DN26749_c0_g1_i1:70-1413(+)